RDVQLRVAADRRCGARQVRLERCRALEAAQAVLAVDEQLTGEAVRGRGDGERHRVGVEVALQLRRQLLDARNGAGVREAAGVAVAEEQRLVAQRADQRTEVRFVAERALRLATL